MRGPKNARGILWAVWVIVAMGFQSLACNISLLVLTNIYFKI